eukprot:gb/GECG01008808.1/.p1 GENE.gb/GECG01008808.1/~~gb/GECG01008808.1/.p1  ORF type:complete len:207 (+),score=21.92 gb/GECG01008808.1/:1-621(+)
MLSSSTVEPGQEYGISFRSDEWLSHFRKPGDGPTSTPFVPRQCILDYFALSPFFKKDALYENASISQESLKRWTGTQYTLRESDLEQHQVFLIREQYRISEDLVHTKRLYYYFMGTIYPNPPIYHVISSRVRQITKRVREATRIIREDKNYSPEEGHSWSHEAEEFGEEHSRKKAKKRAFAFDSRPVIEQSFRNTLEDIRKHTEDG